MTVSKNGLMKGSTCDEFLWRYSGPTRTHTKSPANITCSIRACQDPSPFRETNVFWNSSDGSLVVAIFPSKTWTISRLKSFVTKTPAVTTSLFVVHPTWRSSRVFPKEKLGPAANSHRLNVCSIQKYLTKALKLPLFC